MIHKNEPPRSGNSGTGNRIEALQRKVLEMALRERFSCDLVGTILDELGEEFLYIIHARGILSEFTRDPLTCIHISRSTGPDVVLSAYIAHCIEEIGMLNDEEKEMCCHNIERAGIL